MSMRFSWIGLIVAPLLAPAIFSAVMVGVGSGAKGVSGYGVLMFLLVLLAGSIVSYGLTIVLFLPSLFLLSVWWPVTGFRVCLLGLGLGVLAIVPITFLEWTSTGPDSGPPTESFFEFFPRWVASPFTAIWPLAGLLTAGAYWWLGSRRWGHRHVE
jgi:hypothetical protein